MSKFRPRLSRYNTNCCYQVMPVPVIPLCAVSCCMPQPICEYNKLIEASVSTTTTVSVAAASIIEAPTIKASAIKAPPIKTSIIEASAIEASAIEASAIEALKKQRDPLQIPDYSPELPTPSSGTILTNTTKTIPSGYLAADGTEQSRAIYSSLFSVISTHYGDGDGTTTFNLPNLSYEDSNCVVSYIIKT